MTPARSFGAAVRSARRERLWTQEQLAFEANLHRTYIADLERGARNPSLTTVHKLSQALGLAYNVSSWSPPSALIPRQPLPDRSGDPARRVTVFHGRALKDAENLFIFLRTLGLEPLDWDDMVAWSAKGSPYPGEVLATAFKSIQAAVVLMTPDDEVRLHSSALPGEAAADYALQPRQNVLIELGMALGWDEDRTIIVEAGRLRAASDVAGRHVVRAKPGTGWREQLARRLQTAGCPVNRSPGWLGTPEL